MTQHFLTTPSFVTGTRIRELRDRSGVSRQTLATRSNVHASNLARIERGSSNPSLDTLVRIADALDTSVADLVRDVRQG
ncbi:MAG: helix-turn-helix domain-containing protein [Leucobacter sp.]